MQTQIKDGYKVLFKLFLQCLILEPHRFPAWKLEHKKKEIFKALDFLPGRITPEIYSHLKTVAFGHTVAAVPFCARHKFNFQQITPFSESMMLYMRRAIFIGLECESYEQALLRLVDDLEDKSSILAARFRDCKLTTFDVLTMQKSISCMLFVAYLTDIALTEALPDTAITDFEKLYTAGSTRMGGYVEGKAHQDTPPLEMAIGMFKAQAHG